MASAARAFPVLRGQRVLSGVVGGGTGDGEVVAVSGVVGHGEVDLSLGGEGPPALGDLWGRARREAGDPGACRVVRGPTFLVIPARRATDYRSPGGPHQLTARWPGNGHA